MARTKARDGVYQRPDRPGFWGSWVDASGRRRRRKLNAPTLQQARTLLNAEKARADELKTKGYAAPSADSFGSILDLYMKHQKPRLSHGSYGRTKGIAEKYLRPAFGQLRIGDIRRTDIQDYITRRAGEASAATTIKEANVLKHLLGLAVEWELIPFNPAAKIKTPRPPAGRVRYLGPGELRTLIDACPDWLRPIVILAAFTGMRRGEILALRWMHVDLPGNRLMLPQTKNGDSRIVHVNGYARQAILSQWNADVRPVDRVFKLADDCTADNISKGFVSAAKRAGIPDLHFHDTRHIAASLLRLQGADIHTVATILGHKDLRMAMRYQHLSPEYLGAAMNRLDSVFVEPKKLAAKSESGEDQIGDEAHGGEVVTAASPRKIDNEEEAVQLIDLVGSAIGDRTRTLRLERATC